MAKQIVVRTREMYIKGVPCCECGYLVKLVDRPQNKQDEDATTCFGCGGELCGNCVAKHTDQRCEDLKNKN